MSDPTLARLTYARTACFAQDTDPRSINLEIGRILRKSRINNPKRGIGGVLHYGHGYFFQVLEGPRGTITALLRTIMADPRHRDVHVLTTGAIDRRCFPDWSMKHVPLEQEMEQLIRCHGINRFNSYLFDEIVIEEMIDVLVGNDDPHATPAQNSRRGSLRSSLERLLGRR